MIRGTEGRNTRDRQWPALSSVLTIGCYYLGRGKQRDRWTEYEKKVVVFSPENALVLHQLHEGDINHSQIRALKSMQS